MKIKITSLLLLAALLLAFAGQALAASKSEDGPEIVAVAFTCENYSGVSWAIRAVGEYELWKGFVMPKDWKGFALPNDSISSIRVRPGYMVTLYQHSEFGGESMNIMAALPDLKENARWASSLKVALNPNEEADNDPAWAQNALKTGGFQKASAGGRGNEDTIHDFKNMYAAHWYGGTTDNQRIQMGGQLLKAFAELGYDTGEWQADSFAQQMNNFFDWRKDKSIWEIACMILNVEYTEE